MDDKRIYIINIFVLNGTQFTYEISWRQRRNIVEQWDKNGDLKFQSDNKKIYFKYSQIAGMILEPVVQEDRPVNVISKSAKKLSMSCS